MSITYTWKINDLERNSDDGIVTTGHYTVIAEDDNYKSSSYGSVGFSAPEEGYTVVPFEDLTEELCCGWVKDALGEEEVSRIEAALQTNIDEQYTPVSESGTPW